MRRSVATSAPALDRPHERRDVAAVHLEVHVEVARDLAARRAEAVGDGGAAAAVPLVEDHAQVEPRVRGHDLAAGSRACASRLTSSTKTTSNGRPACSSVSRISAKLAREVLGLVVAGEHQAQVRGAPPRSGPASRTASITRSTSVARRAAGAAAGAAASPPRGRSPAAPTSSAERPRVGRRVQGDVVERRHDALRPQRAKRRVAQPRRPGRGGRRCGGSARAPAARAGRRTPRSAAQPARPSR